MRFRLLTIRAKVFLCVFVFFERDVFVFNCGRNGYAPDAWFAMPRGSNLWHWSPIYDTMSHDTRDLGARGDRDRLQVVVCALYVLVNVIRNVSDEEFLCSCNDTYVRKCMSLRRLFIEHGIKFVNYQISCFVHSNSLNMVSNLWIIKFRVLCMRINHVPQSIRCRLA